MRNRIAAVILFIVITLPAAGVSADEHGSRAQAESLLKRAANMLRMDEKRALDLFTSGQGGFMFKDLYVYCMGPDGMLTAHPHFMGLSLKNWKDNSGKPVGQEILSVAQEGKFAEVSYIAPQPKDRKASAVDPSKAKQVEKVSFVTKVGEQICGVGYYK